MATTRSPLDRLCEVARLSDITEIERAELLIWYAMRLQDRPAAYLPFVADLFVAAHFSKPNVTRLKANLKKRRTVISREAQEGTGQFSLQRQRLEELDKSLMVKVFGTPQDQLLDAATEALEAQAAKTQNPHLRAFLEEAIGCVRAKFYRAATVLAWSGALEYMLDFVFRTKLKEFNAAAIARGFIKKPISSRTSGFDRVGEANILQVCEDIGVFGKSVKKQLEQCLDRRNACGHPNDFKPGPQQVRSDIEFLIAHVFVL